MKTCSKCGETKEYSEFYKSVGKISCWCKICARKHQQKKTEERREKSKSVNNIPEDMYYIYDELGSVELDIDKNWYEKHAEKPAKNYLHKYYGIKTKAIPIELLNLTKVITIAKEELRKHKQVSA